MSMNIERDAFRFLIPLMIGGQFFIVFGWNTVALFTGGLILFVAYFFRDPDRSAPEGEELIVSPADGAVAKIDTSYKSQSHPDGAVCVSIFLSIFNVHVQRSPISGTVTGKFYNKGKFLAAWNHKASYDNEQTLVTLDTKIGKVGVKQIAGLIARRIVCRVDVGQRLDKGERFGLIRFGSRVDLIIPQGCEVACKVGDKVRGGRTVIAKAPTETLS